MDVLPFLQDVHECLLAGKRPVMGSQELASIVCSVICPSWWETPVPAGQTTGPGNACGDCGNGRCHPLTTRGGQNNMGMVCLGLSLLESMSNRQLSGGLQEEVRLYYKEVLMKASGDWALSSTLLNFFAVQDTLLSHFAMKCTSSVVLFQLCESNSFDTAWQEKCIDVLKNPHPGNELACTLWSLTGVIKGLLTGVYRRKKDALERLVVTLSAVLPGLYSGLLVWIERGRDTPGVHSNDSFDLTTNLVAVLDLLEALLTARLKVKVCLSSQRLFFQQASVALQLASAPVHYLVQKKALLLLKACLLLKVGDDFMAGGAEPPLGGDPQMISDILALAGAVLCSVAAGWLRQVPVSTEAAFFGGNSPLGRTGPDSVMLRAVSLILLKSLEYKIQYGREEGLDSAVDSQSFLLPLSLFLNRHLSGSPRLDHPCVWVSVVFGEQDDDMIEAARILLSLYLRQRRSSGPSDLKACVTGCSPHCHFIYLLRSITFDHSVLLDFLISSETCFLDYFVRYLKLLRESWGDFEVACRRTEALEPDAAMERPTCRIGLLTAPGGAMSTAGGVGTPLNEWWASGNQAAPSSGGATRTPARPLVNYDSSDESDSEVPSAECVPIRGNEPLESLEFGQVAGQSGCLRDCTEQRLRKDPWTPARSCRRAAMCLRELRKVILRLQKRKLFPYKPDSLLKLLMEVGIKSGFEPQAAFC